MSVPKAKLVNLVFQQFIGDASDAMMAQLVREYLEFTNLEYACSVFNAETEHAGNASPRDYG